MLIRIETFFNFVASSSLGSNALPSVNLTDLNELVDIIEDILKDIAVVLIVLGSVMLVIVLLGLCGACYKIKIFLYGVRSYHKKKPTSN